MVLSLGITLENMYLEENAISDHMAISFNLISATSERLSVTFFSVVLLLPRLRVLLVLLNYLFQTSLQCCLLQDLGSVSGRRLRENSEYVNSEMRETGFYGSKWEVCQSRISQARF